MNTTEVMLVTSGAILATLSVQATGIEPRLATTVGMAIVAVHAGMRMPVGSTWTEAMCNGGIALGRVIGTGALIIAASRMATATDTTW